MTFLAHTHKLHVAVLNGEALTADGSAQGETPRDEGKMMSAEAVAERLVKGVYKRKFL